MARRPGNIDDPNAIPRPIEQHIRALNLSTPDQYYDWCWANGFDGSIYKTKADLQEELDKFHELAKKREAQNRLHKNPKAFLQAVCTGEFTSDEIDRPNFKAAAIEIEASEKNETARQSLSEMLADLIRHEDLIFDTAGGRNDPPFIRGLIKMHDRKALWLRPIEEWKPKSKNAVKKFGELTHHLFDQYGDVPHFMEKVWLRDDRASWRYRDWYIHLGRGHNLRTAKSPVPITKKMAHNFLMAPNDFSLEQAVRWSQLKALGASTKAIHAVAATRLCRSFENEEFWFTVLRFIAENSMLDPRQIGPLIDFLHNQKYQNVEIEVRPGEFAQQPPPQPGLSMVGRTVATLMRQVIAWHDTLSRTSAHSDVAYATAEFEGTTIEKRTGKKSIRWVIRQLRSGNELQLESEDLRHCVSSYHWSCAKGECTIWNLSETDEAGKLNRVVTIEVDKNKTIVQCRGHANRDPSANEWAVINSWAREQELSISTYL